MHSFLSSPQLPNTVNLPDSLFSSTTVNRDTDLLTPRNLVQVQSVTQAKILTPQRQPDVLLKASGPVFKEKSFAEQQIYIAAPQPQTQSSKQVAPSLLVELAAISFSAKIHSNALHIKDNQGHKKTVPLPEVLVRPTPSSRISLPVIVVKSTPDLLVVTAPASLSETTTRTINIPLDNPDRRPTTGQSINLHVAVVKEQLAVQWSVPHRGQVPLVEVNQPTHAATPAKQLLLATSPQHVTLRTQVMEHHLTAPLVPAETIDAVTQPKAREIVFNTKIANVIATLESKSLPPANIVKPDFVHSGLPTKTQRAMHSLPVISFRAISAGSEQIDVNEAIQKFSAMTPSETLPPVSQLSDQDKGLLATALQSMLRKTAGHFSPSPNLDKLVKGFIRDRLEAQLPPSTDIRQGDNSTNSLTNSERQIVNLLRTLFSPPLIAKHPQSSLPQGQSAGTMMDSSSQQKSPLPQKPELPKISGDVQEPTDTVLESLAESGNTPKEATTIKNDKGSVLVDTIRRTVMSPLFAVTPTTIAQANVHNQNDSLATALLKALSIVVLAKTKTDISDDLAKSVQNKSRQPQSPAGTVNTASNSNRNEPTFMKSALEMLVNHQVNKLSSADSTLMGQEQLYYSLPASTPLHSPTEFLIKPINEEESSTQLRLQRGRAWQLTLKLNVGKLGNILAKSIVTEQTLDLALYTDSDSLLTRVQNTLPSLESRLKTIDGLALTITAQQGVIPKTLKPQTLHLLETHA